MIEILIPVSVAELIDRISILEIKAERIRDPQKRANVGAELQMLRAVELRAGLDGLEDLTRELDVVNRAIWDAEEGLRFHAAAGDFGVEFVAYACRSYQNNERRAAIKRKINLATSSAIIEAKSYDRN